MGHHHIPQWHLSKFQTSGRPGRIWQHDRRGGPTKIAAILNFAQVRKYYSDPMDVRLANEVD